MAAASILVVDDEPRNLKILSDLLGDRGYRVRAAIDGETALQAIRAESPDLILLDIMMPGQNGYAVCQQLKATPATAPIPVIFLSALSDVADKLEAFRAGGSDYIVKPFHAAEVMARVEAHLALYDRQRSLQDRNDRLQVEIEQRQRAEREAQFLLRVIQAASSATEFDRAMQAFALEVRRACGWAYAEVWETVRCSYGNASRKPDASLNGGTGRRRFDGPGALRLTQRSGKFPAAALPAPVEAFQNFGDRRTLAWGSGAIGRAWAAGRVSWLADLAAADGDGDLANSNADCDWRSLALKAGWHSALIVPICWSDAPSLALRECLSSVLVLYDSAPRPLDAGWSRCIETAASELCGLLRRIHTEDALQHANRELQRLSSLDELTQLPNRRCFNETLAREWAQAQRRRQPLSLILADVDHFKRYNDWNGHLAGDRCLQAVARALQTSVRQPEDLVARYGGEEFAAILPGADRQAALTVARRIRMRVAALNLSHGDSPTSSRVTLSLGIATAATFDRRVEPTTLDPFVNAADTALYRAKQEGRDRACWQAFPEDRSLTPTAADPTATPAGGERSG